MPCNRCNGPVELVEESGGITEGQFQERYECASCNALGYIEGEASEPAEKWNRYGSVFGQ